MTRQTPVSAETVERTSGAERAALDDVRVDHGRTDVGMPQKLLDGADVRAGFEQMGGETVAEYVAGNRFANAGPVGGSLDRPLDGTVEDVIPGDSARARLAAEIPGRKHELPAVLESRIRIFPLQRVRQDHAAAPAQPVIGAQRQRMLDSLRQAGNAGIGQDGDPVLRTLSIAHRDRSPFEIDIFHSKSGRLADPQPGSVKQSNEEIAGRRHMGKYRADFSHRQYDRNPRRSLGPHDFVEPRKIDLQYPPIKEKHPVQRLVLGRRRAMPVHGKVAEKCSHLLGPHGLRMTLAVKQDEPPRPVQIRFLGTNAVMLQPNDPAHPVQELLRHARNPDENRAIRPETFLACDRKSRRMRVGKCDSCCRKMPHISRGKNYEVRGINSLPVDPESKCAINTHFARIFDKNTIRHIFSSYKS